MRSHELPNYHGPSSSTMIRVIWRISFPSHYPDDCCLVCFTIDRRRRRGRRTAVLIRRRGCHRPSQRESVFLPSMSSRCEYLKRTDEGRSLHTRSWNASVRGCLSSAIMRLSVLPARASPCRASGRSGSLPRVDNTGGSGSDFGGGGNRGTTPTIGEHSPSLPGGRSTTSSPSTGQRSDGAWNGR